VGDDCVERRVGGFDSAGIPSPEVQALVDAFLPCEPLRGRHEVGAEIDAQHGSGEVRRTCDGARRQASAATNVEHPHGAQVDQCSAGAS
jgi:hypothetical protein